MNTLKTVAKWGGPSAALLAIYGAAAGIPTVPVAALLVGGGVMLSWLAPMVVKFVKSKVG